MLFNVFNIIWPGDLIFNTVNVILAILIEDHLMLIPMKFGELCKHFYFDIELIV